eukprot:12914705-Ditylum_brightwellii.AAC.1
MMKEPDKKEFLMVIVAEVNTHTECKNCKLVPLSKLPEGVQILRLSNSAIDPGIKELKEAQLDIEDRGQMDDYLEFNVEHKDVKNHLI